jgi:hypothetical protein
LQKTVKRGFRSLCSLAVTPFYCREAQPHALRYCRQSVSLTPTSRNVFVIALITAAGASVAPASPAFLTPIGFVVQGISTNYE